MENEDVKTEGDLTGIEIALVIIGGLWMFGSIYALVAIGLETLVVMIPAWIGFAIAVYSIHRFRIKSNWKTVICLILFLHIWSAMSRTLPIFTAHSKWDDFIGWLLFIAFSLFIIYKKRTHFSFDRKEKRISFLLFITMSIISMIIWLNYYRATSMPAFWICAVFASAGFIGWAAWNQTFERLLKWVRMAE